MQQNRSSMFVQEIEHGLYGRSYAWEGKPEQVFNFGEIVVHAQPKFAVALCFRFISFQINERLDEIIHQIESRLAQRCLWVIGPNTQEEKKDMSIFDKTSGRLLWYALSENVTREDTSLQVTRVV